MRERLLKACSELEPFDIRFSDAGWPEFNEQSRMGKKAMQRAVFDKIRIHAKQLRKPFQELQVIEQSCPRLAEQWRSYLLRSLTGK